MKMKGENVHNLKKYIKNSKQIWSNCYNSDIDEKLMFLEKNIKNNKYKGIIVYPEAVKWDPVQRPQHLLREFGKKGFLCLFLENNNTLDIKIEEKYENVYLINGQDKVISFLKDKNVIFMITYFLQYIYVEQFSEKIIWFDLLDRLDFFSYYNWYSKMIWNKLIKNADFVTYSADELKKFIINRKDAILIPNAANIEDFIIESNYVPKDLENILKSKKKILGYYGAVEEWFDFSIIEKLSSTDKYEIVIIGKCNNKVDLKNVYYLGQKDYKDLKYYSRHFDIALIPFVVNNLTNAVSPVKFFEYICMNIPVLTTNIREMRKYDSPIIEVVEDNDDLDSKVQKLLSIDKKIVKSECQKILDENTWKNRAEKILDLIEGGNYE